MDDRKVIIIGIDSLEPRFVETLVSRGISRGFKYFYEDGIVLRMRSTFPPDTVLAWPTIYTGLVPQRFNLRPEPESILEMQVKSLDVRMKIKGKTFWDIASRLGKRVCVVNPIFAYPPWHVNGVMVSGPSFGLRGSTLSVPPMDYAKKYKLGTYGRTPLLIHEYKEMYSEALQQLLDVFRLTITLLNRDNYDLVFTADYTLDRVQHYFWRFDDEDDPHRPKLINVYKGFIEKYYELLDRLIAYFIEKYSDEYTVIVLGDHGHARRPTRLISVEKILNARLKQASVTDILKDILALLMFYSNTDVYAYKIIRYLQSAGKLGRMLLKNVEGSLKGDNNIIETIKLFGLKEYVGIRINVDSKQYKAKLIELITRILRKLDIVDFVMQPEEYYGVNFEYEADLYLKLRDFGNYPNVKSFLVIPNFTRHIISGGHSIYTLFMVYPNKKIQLKNVRNNEMRVQDVAPTILALLGLKNKMEVAFDGISLL